MRIYLTDKVSGTEQDLLPDKVYSLSLGAGEYNDRFFLNFPTKQPEPMEQEQMTTMEPGQMTVMEAEQPTTMEPEQTTVMEPEQTTVMEPEQTTIMKMTLTRT